MSGPFARYVDTVDQDFVSLCRLVTDTRNSGEQANRRIISVLVMGNLKATLALWRELKAWSISDRFFSKECSNFKGVTKGLEFHDDSLAIYIDSRHTLFIASNRDTLQSASQRIEFDLVHFTTTGRGIV